MLSTACCIHLASLGLGISFPPGAGVPAYAEELPGEPDAAVAAFVLLGSAPPDLSGYVTPIVQIVVRGAAGDRETAADLARAIRSALDGTDTVTWAAGTAHAVELLTVATTTSHPTNRGLDLLGRPLWSVDFRVEYLED